MARKTKQEALQTRQEILNAAEILFRKQGVSRTSLQQIAQAANVTRGAIYWHFSDKLALFQALLERAALPCDEIFAHVENQKELTAGQRILLLVSEIVKLVSGNEQIRNIFDIVSHKMEIVDEFAVLSERYLRHLNRIITVLARYIHEEFNSHKKTITDPQAYSAARSLNALVDGLFHSWIHAPHSFNIYETVLINVQYYLLGFFGCFGIKAPVCSFLPPPPLQQENSD